MSKSRLFAASIGAYIISLCLPAFYLSGSVHGSDVVPMFGFNAAFAGMFGWLGGYFCGLANPLIFAVWIASKKAAHFFVIVGGIFACALCLTFLFHHTILMDEGGNKATIVGLGPGFWLWLLSPVLMVVHGILSLKKQEVTHA
ncbi:MAG: hypothetical protein JF609_01015 [Verrucomicrobia bacterium]|nr:hypothetical protein [Verrucomicrobiota bacterium]